MQTRSIGRLKSCSRSTTENRCAWLVSLSSEEDADRILELGHDAAGVTKLAGQAAFGAAVRRRNVLEPRGIRSALQRSLGRQK